MATYETTTTTSTSTTCIHPDVGYVKSIPSILKIVEFVVCIIILICVSVVDWVRYGAGWIQFVSVAACVVTSLFFVFHFLHIFEKLPGPWPLIEFIAYVVLTVFFLICVIVALVRVASVRGERHAPITATAFFCFVATAVYCVDTFFQYRGWKMTGSSHAATTTSSSNVETTTTTTTKCVQPRRQLKPPSTESNHVYYNTNTGSQELPPQPDDENRTNATERTSKGHMQQAGIDNRTNAIGRTFQEHSEQAGVENLTNATERASQEVPQKSGVENRANEYARISPYQNTDNVYTGLDSGHITHDEDDTMSS